MKLLHIIGLFFLVALLIYGRTIGFDFVAFDDSILVYDNISVLRPLTWSSIGWALSHYDPELYIPVTFLSFQLDSFLSGLQPWLFHLTNIVLHTCNALLVAVFVALFMKPLTPTPNYQPPTPILVGLLFLVHPLNVEAVAWVSGRKDLLATFFFLLSLVVYMRNDRRAWSLVWFVLALGSNVRTVILAPLLLLLHWYQDGRISLQAVRRTVWHFVAAIPFGLIALLGKDQVIARTDAGNVFLLVPRSITFYLEKFFAPLNLSILYPYEFERITFASLDITLSWVFVAAVIGVLIVFRRRLRLWIFALSWFLLALFPSFFQYYRGYELYFATDRYMYIPMIGLLVLLAVLLTEVQSRRNITVGILSAIVLLFGGLSFARSAVWENTYTLFSDILTKHESALAYQKVGTQLLIRKQYSDAVDHFIKALELDPNNAASYYYMGLASMELGNPEDGFKLTEEALRLNPDYPHAHINMSKLLWDQDKREEALKHAERAVELHGWDMMGLGNLATMYTLTGNTQGARETIEWILELDPDNERVGPLLRMLE